MPFDTVNFQPEPSRLLRLLLRARDRIKKGWVQNAAIRVQYTPKGARYSYCLMGSIAFGDEGLGFTDPKDVNTCSQAQGLLLNKISHKYHRTSIPSFNDHYCTSKNLVVGVLDEVIAEQETREVTAKVTAQ
jgi:hypothetical protein